jgi:mRNA interferase MazF
LFSRLCRDIDDFDRCPLILAQASIRWADAPGNLRLAARFTNLEHDSVANVSQILTIDKALLTEHVGKLSRAKVNVLLSGIDVVLGR